MPSTTPQNRSQDDDLAMDTDDDSSELSESSEEPSSDEDSDESDESDESMAEDGAPVNVRANRGKKPTMKFRKNEFGPDIRIFLKEFLPQLKASNDELLAERAAGTLKRKQIETEGNDEGQYIQMDLGLGVLEERDPDADSESSDSEMESEDKEKDILGLLMGRHRISEPVGIQEVQGKP